ASRCPRASTSCSGTAGSPPRLSHWESQVRLASVPPSKSNTYGPPSRRPGSVPSTFPSTSVLFMDLPSFRGLGDEGHDSLRRPAAGARRRVHLVATAQTIRSPRPSLMELPPCLGISSPSLRYAKRSPITAPLNILFAQP